VNKYNNVIEDNIDVNSVKAAVMRIDTTKQIFDLWYEVFYLRAILSMVIGDIKHIDYDAARKMAKHWMKEKFPGIDLEYPEIKEPP
jgi:hypothetical protein